MPDITITTYEGTEISSENFGYTISTGDGHTIPPGGTEGQVLGKASDAHYDVEWVDGGIGAGSDVTLDSDGSLTVDGTTVELATDAQLSSGLAGKSDTGHTHVVADTTGLQAALDAKETPAGAQSKADAAQTAAESTAATALATHAADTTAVHGITDTSALIVEGDSRLTNSRTPSGAAGGVLSGTYPNPGFAADMATQAELDAHVNDTSAAHSASAISYAGSANLSATDVEAALDELDSEKAAASDLTGKIDKSTLDANTILYATTDDTPAALSVSASRIVGRKASGNISAMTLSEFLDFATGTRDGTKFLRDDGTWQTVSGGGGAVNVDTIWDAKGDLAVATGSDAASKLAVGTIGQSLTPDSSASTGLAYKNLGYKNYINDDLSSLTGWTQDSGTWSIVSGVFQSTNAGAAARVKKTGLAAPGVAAGLRGFSVDLKYVSGSGANRRMGIFFGYGGVGTASTVFYIETANDTTFDIKAEYDASSAQYDGANITYSTGNWVNLAFQQAGGIGNTKTIDIFVDGVFYDTTVLHTQYNQIALYAYSTVAQFRNLKTWYQAPPWV